MPLFHKPEHPRKRIEQCFKSQPWHQLIPLCQTRNLVTKKCLLPTHRLFCADQVLVQSVGQPIVPKTRIRNPRHGDTITVTLSECILGLCTTITATKGLCPWTTPPHKVPSTTHRSTCDLDEGPVASPREFELIHLHLL